MSTEYVKTNWQDGDIITADKMNNIENGIKDVEGTTTSLKDDYTTILDSAYVTDTANGAIASFPDGADNVPVKSLKVQIEPVQAGTGDPSPSNVRPISGWTQAVVTRTGKNLFPSDVTWKRNNVGGFSPASADDSTIRIRTSSFAIKTGTYVISGIPSGSSLLSVRTFDASKTRIEPDIDPNNGVFTLGSNVAYIHLLFGGSGYNSSTASTFANLQLEVGSTATAYEPYQSNTYTIDLDGTRYGGTLDVTTGVLTVDMALVDMGTLTWMLNGGYFKSASLDSVIKRPVSNTDVPQIICSIYFPVDWNTTADKSVSVVPMTVSSPNTFLWIKNSAYADAESFKTAMNGVQLCYKLATPTAVQLTAEEVTTLKGQNNIWADCGDVEVEYRADTKLYINKVLNA